MKKIKLDEMSVKDLEKELSELKTELFKLKFSLATSGLDNPLKVREVRRNIARVQTEIRKTVNECTLTTEDIPNIYINYKDSYVSYTFLVITNTIEDNFKACSHIREKLMQRLASKNIHIPYNQLDINIHNWHQFKIKW